jgi:ketosteroid isomerase-like protein
VASENVEVVRRGFDALRDGGVDALIELVDLEFEITTPSSLASEPDTYRGAEGIRRWFDSFQEVMDEISIEPRSFREVGDRVVVESTLRARGRTTGLEFSQHAYQVWTLRDGKAVRLEVYPELDQALEAARPGGGIARE